MGGLVAVVAAVVASTGQIAIPAAGAAEIAIPVAAGSVTSVLPGLMISTGRSTTKAWPPL